MFSDMGEWVYCPRAVCPFYFLELVRRKILNYIFHYASQKCKENPRTSPENLSRLFFLFEALSLLDPDNEPFCTRKVDGAMSNADKTSVRGVTEVVEMGNIINDPEFSAKASEMVSALIRQIRPIESVLTK